MLHKTKAIILRTIPYSETSLVVTAYTEQFGLQSYLVKGARRVSKKGSSMAPFFQPAAILELVVYHNELKQLQLIKEIKWAHIYQQVFSQVLKNAVALFIAELLGKCLKEPEQNTGLFAFAENNLLILDAADAAVTANLPLHFALHLAGQLGFRMEDNYDMDKTILDLQEGSFTEQIPIHGFYIDGKLSEITNDLLHQESPVTLYRIKLNQHMRQQLLKAYEQFFLYHVADFGGLKTVGVLVEVLG